MMDYNDYIKKLPTDQKKALIVNDHMIRLFEDGTGNQAIQIKILVGQTLWRHVLVYDQAHKRAKVMTYKKGHLVPE